jgi:hypothetical protein
LEVKLLPLVLKYIGVAIACYVLIQLEVQLHGAGIRQLFPTDGHKWLNMQDTPLALSTMRIAWIIFILPLGWVNVFLAYKFFQQLPKAIWLMAILTTYHWILLVVLFWALSIPGYYSPSIVAIIILSIVGSWAAVFHFRKKQIDHV